MDLKENLICDLEDTDKKYYEHNIDEEAYEDIIFNSKYDDFEFAIFLRAKYYFFKKEYTRAKTEIERIYNKTKPHSFHLFVWADKRIDTYTLKKVEYDLAAEIYAELDNNEKSLQFYKRSRYYSTISQSDFSGMACAYVYSFRQTNTYALSDIATNSITVCNPSVMNDPLDSLYQHWATYGNFNKTSSRKKHIKSLVDSYRYFRVRSFVGNKKLTKDNSVIRKVTMWSHYADNHKGFCIRYKFSKGMIDHSDKDQYRHYFLKRISYNKVRNKIDIVVSEMDYNQLFTTKSYEWKYENEVRFISYDPTCEEDYLQIKLDLDSQIDAIYFGYRCTDSDIALIKKVAGDKVKYYKMDIDPSNVYRLSIKQM